MRIGILGTGSVASVLAPRLFALKHHEVCVGARSSNSETLEPFAELEVLTGSFAEAAATSELVINATNGNHSVEAVASAASALEGKTLIDLSNRLDHSKGMARAAMASNESSAAEEIQAAAPGANVVKALNTMSAHVMMDPSLVPGEHLVFLSGDSAEAKQEVKHLLGEVGWRESQMMDLGGLETATGPEMLMQLWLDVMVARGGFDAGPFNLAINS